MAKRIILLGTFKQTLTAVRSLGRAGMHVTLARFGGTPAYPERSRFATDHLSFGDCRDTPSFIDALETQLQDSNPQDTYLFPVGELSLERVASAYERFQDRATLVMPDAKTALNCLDKTFVHAVASELGLPLPETFSYTNTADWQTSANAIGFPVLIKRKTSQRLVDGKKALICRNPVELARFLLDGNDPEPQSLLLQKYFEGIRHNCHFAALNGELVTFFQQKVLRTDTHDGTGYGVEGVSVAPNSQLRDLTARLVRRLDYSGVGCVQFLVNEATGECAFLEINPRLDATCALPLLCGVDFPQLAVACAAYRAHGGTMPVGPASYPVGVGAYWMLGDLFGLLHALNHRKIGLTGALYWLGRTALACLSYRNHMTWSWSDPLPTLQVYAESFALVALRPLRRIRSLLIRLPA